MLAIDRALLIGIAKPTAPLSDVAGRGRRVHPDHMAVGAGQRAAGVALDDAGVGLEHAVQRLAGRLAAVAGRDGLVQPGDRAGRRGNSARAVGVAHGHDAVADLDLGRVTERDGLQAVRVDQLDHGDVVGRVVAEPPGRESLAGRHHDRVQLRGVGDHVVVREHEPVAADHHAGRGGLAALVLQVARDVDQAGLDRVDHRALGRRADPAVRVAAGIAARVIGEDRQPAAIVPAGPPVPPPLPPLPVCGPLADTLAGCLPTKNAVAPAPAAAATTATIR